MPHANIKVHDIRVTQIFCTLKYCFLKDFRTPTINGLPLPVFRPTLLEVTQRRPGYIQNV